MGRESFVSGQGLSSPDTDLSSKKRATITSLEKFETRRLFVLDAFKNGAHLKIPTDIHEDGWKRQKQAIIMLDIGSLSEAELARRLGEDRTTVNNLHRQALINLWNNLGKEVQKKYPLESILGGRKPLSLESREQRFNTYGGSNTKIKKIAEEEMISNPAEIAFKLDMSPEEVTNRRKEVLEKWKVDILPPRQYDENFAKKIQQEQNYQKLQKWLERIPLGSIKTLLSKGILITLSKIAKQNGYHFRNSDMKFFTQTIERSNEESKLSVPIRKAFMKEKRNRKKRVQFIVVYSKHQADIIKILSKNHKLDRFKENPVELIAGTFDGPMPPTSEFRKEKMKYSPASSLIKEVTGHSYRGHDSLELFEDSFTPFFRVHGGAYYLKDKKSEAERTIEKNYKRLKLKAS